MMTPEISVVMPSRNEGNNLIEAVESIVAGRSTEFPLEIVVVDDASSDDREVRRASQFHAPYRNVSVKTHRLPRWSGIPYARNIGATLASAPTLFITDANVLFPKHWDSVIRASRTGSDRILCAAIGDTDSYFIGYGCTLLFPSLGVGYLPSPRAWGGYVPVVPCTCMVIAANLFRRLGGFDTALPLYGAAEPEFSVRAWLLGAEIVSMPALVLKHHFRPARKHEEFLSRFEQQFTQNYLRFCLLYLEGSLLNKVLQHYAESRPESFQAALAAAAKPDTWTRRDLLRRTLRYPFSEYLRRFPGLPGVC